MRLVIASILAAALAPTSAFAERVFDGTIIYTDQSHCTVANGMFARTSQFYPRGVGGANMNRTVLTEYDQKAATAYSLSSGDFTTAFKDVRAVFIYYRWYTFTAKVRVTSQVPATITANTRFVTLTGQIQSPGNDPGDGMPCVATFKASYVGVTR